MSTTTTRPASVGAGQEDHARASARRTSPSASAAHRGPGSRPRGAVHARRDVHGDHRPANARSRRSPRPALRPPVESGAEDRVRRRTSARSSSRSSAASAPEHPDVRRLEPPEGGASRPSRSVGPGGEQHDRHAHARPARGAAPRPARRRRCSPSRTRRPPAGRTRRRRATRRARHRRARRSPSAIARPRLVRALARSSAAASAGVRIAQHHARLTAATQNAAAIAARA